MPVPRGRELQGWPGCPSLSMSLVGATQEREPPRKASSFPFPHDQTTAPPRGHQLAPWQSHPELEWAPGTLLYFQEVVRTWAQGGVWLLCSTIDSGSQRVVPPDRAQARGCQKREHFSRGCRSSLSRGPQYQGLQSGSCLPSSLLPSTSPSVGQSPKGVNALVGPIIVTATNSAINSGFLRALDVS